MSEPRTGYRVEEGVDLERLRLDALGATFDPGSRAVLERLVQPGDRCLDVGAGGGSIARWLAERVGATGSVVATDVDVQFLGDVPSNTEVRRHDITSDPLPDAEFDVVHARGVLQHIERRDEALASMVAATRPGGIVVVEDSDFATFEHQDLPEPFGGVCRTLNDAYAEMSGHDRYLGRRLVPWLRSVGLVEVDAQGYVFTMHGGSASTEWYVLGFERAGPALAAAGLLEETTLADAIGQARHPSFAVTSPLAMAGWGRRPE